MELEMLVRFLLAALWGGIVGAEREYRSKSAGFRTMIMISLGACFFTMMSMAIGSGNNPDRIASNIVTGIGFLGAGVIFKGDNRVNGITTAASIWAVAAVGMGIGAGYYWAAGSISIIILLVLSVLPHLENVIDRANQQRIYTIKSIFSEGRVPEFETAMKQSGLKYRISNQVKEEQFLSTTWMVQGHIKCHEKFIGMLLQNEHVKRFEY
ncbi:MAG: MgtC/SapB family protein [Niastella sp.]|nr:MgtC/SapB family protein [Niastella sp.]